MKIDELLNEAAPPGATFTKRPAAKEAPSEPKSDRDVYKFCNKIESELDHEDRFKDLEAYMDTKTLEWVTQEGGDSSGTAKQIAKLFRQNGWKGWTIKVVLRDNWGDPKTTKWGKAKS